MFRSRIAKYAENTKYLFIKYEKLLTLRIESDTVTTVVGKRCFFSDQK